MELEKENGDKTDAMRSNVFLFVIWSKAKPFNDEIRKRLSESFQILLETEVVWPRSEFTHRLREFYGFGNRFTWWNKARKCGRGPFTVYVVEDTAPIWHRHHDSRGQELLVDDRDYALKQQLRKLTGHSNLVHSSVTHEETESQLKILFGCDPLPIVSALANGTAKRVGLGQRRACFLLPDGATCLKCYRSDAEIDEGSHPEWKNTRPLKQAVIREIVAARYDGWCNTCCQEYAYYLELAKRLPDCLLRVFPEMVKQVFIPGRGYGLLESAVMDADGCPSKTFLQVYVKADPHRQKLLMGALNGLASALEHYAVRFYDPQNVIVQELANGDFRLRIVDFEPESRTFFRPDAICSAFIRMKVRRRFDRFRRQLGVKAHPLPARCRVEWDELIASEGEKIGLSNCRAFLENKLVNDVFYEGTFNGRRCIVKCSSRATYSIRNEYELSKRLFEVDPRACAEPFAVWSSDDGRRAFIVTERLPGPSLTDMRRASDLSENEINAVADDFERISSALMKAGIVHRDMGTSDNFLCGDDGHLRLVDFQFAIDRAKGCVDPWLLAHGKYHYIVFCAQFVGNRAYWNDIGYLVGHLVKRLPRTQHTEEVIGRLTPVAESAGHSEPIALRDRMMMWWLRITMTLQLWVAPKGGRKRHTLEGRLARFRQNSFTAIK